MGVTAPTFTTEQWAVEYARRLMQHLPPGRFFQFSQDSDEFSLLKALGTELGRVREALEVAFAAMHPGRPTLQAALVAWEAALGLPECAEASSDPDRRRQTAWAKFRARQGGQSRAYYTGLIEDRFDMDGEVSITEFDMMDCEDPCEDPLYGPAWMNTWVLNLPMTDLVIMTCEDECTDPLREWGHHELECFLESIKPAHTRLLFSYTEE